MITYSFDEIDILTQIYQESITTFSVDPDGYDNIIEIDYYPKLIQSIIEEKKVPSAVLMEFLGAYESAVSNLESKQYLHDFLFEKPIDDMPLFICSEGDKTWENMVAAWRLKIGK